ncbi:mitochondrial 3'-tRNA processing endonuclease Trz2 [Stylosanthes scabra]|uniref:Mitochondrial 3'-tRNA processing endonuclease Trz2 n=1 Tax=Stylosanthes scabra TaxID=79078 RepID=A0ABU6Z9J3_9FABA|nr:mitochondrial 3'-tRNA processing endonuclease Trz2 [Stylosanthes scabra]
MTFMSRHSKHIMLYPAREKLDEYYDDLKDKPKEIEKLKKSGVEINDEIITPEIAFTSNTTTDFMLDPHNEDALRAKVLITEATFLDESYSVDHARQQGHTHLFEIMENSQRIQNQAVVLTHFSSRYSIEDIHLAVSKLQSNVSAKVVPLTEGFKSVYQ